MKVFIPFSEALIEELGLSIGDLVPFQLEYQCLRMHQTDPTAVGADPVRDTLESESLPQDTSRTESAPTEPAIVPH